MRVEEGKVVGNDRESQRHQQDTDDAACRSYDVAGRSYGADVTVAYGSHGDDGPPEAHRNGGELFPRVLGVLALGVVDHGGKDEHSDQQEDEEHQ